MVYLHGGYLQYGHINVPSYVPDEKHAQDLNVVFVNVQYR
jgi:carboxylesterase type B